MYLSAHLPTWPADRRLRRARRRDDRDRTPGFLILAEATGGRRTVVGACAATLAAGVRVGMTVAHATALLPTGARVLDHTPAADRVALTALARWAVRFTPKVAVDPADWGGDGLTLDVGGSARLFGGLVPLAREVRRALGRLRVGARVAVAPTVGLAWGLARFGDEGVCDPADAEAAVFGLPVAALRIEPDVAAALAEVGVDRAGQLVDLPRREIARRFGGGGGAADVLLRLDQARGEAVELPDWLGHVELPRVGFRFAGPATQYEAVEAVAHDLVGELCDRLAREESAARRLRLEVERRGPDLRPAFGEVTLRLAAPSREVRHVWDVLRPKVEAMDLGRGVEALALSATQVARLAHGQGRYDGERDTSRDERDEARLIDLLQGRLGRENVLRIEPTPSHVPEAAYRLRPADEPRPGRHAEAAGELLLGDRPTRLFDPPEPAEVVYLRPEGPLASLRWRGVPRAIVTTVGPERIGRRWWQTDLSPRTLDVRDYYKLQTDAGLWLWAFRLRGGGEAADRWFVHGVWS